MKKAWVYILECSDRSYYTGCTTNLQQRLTDHSEGKYSGYTSSRLPVKLLWNEEFVDVRDAIVLERQIKRWTRKKKEALMRGDYKLLHELSLSTQTQSKLATSHPPTKIIVSYPSTPALTRRRSG